MPNTKRTRVPEKVARPTRTSIQAGLAALLVAWWSAKVDRLSRDELATYTVIVTAAVNLAWVAIEDRLERGLLRAVPPKDVPAVDDKGESTVAIAALVVGVVAMLLHFVKF